MDIKNLLVLLPVDNRQKQLLQDAAPGIEITYCGLEEATPELVAQADGILGNLEPDKLKAAKNLKWLQLFSAGADPYLAPGALPEGVALTNATGAYGPSVAQHMFAMLMQLCKNLHLYRDNQAGCQWRDEGPVRSLLGMTVLILGLGDIGMAFARLMKPLDSYIIGVRRSPGAAPEGIDEVHTMEKLDSLLPRADVVFMILPGTPATTHIMNRERLALMKTDAILLNAGRGSAIDQEALCEALKNGTIASAGLDVTDPEPLPADSELWRLRNLLLTPHTSGGFHIPDTMERIVNISIENLRRLQQDLPLATPVDLKTGYKVTERI